MKHLTLGLAALVLLGACTGVPLRSVPRLMKLQHELLETQPAEFMIAVQIDARMSPPPNAVPILHLAIRPREPGAFEPVDRSLPMQFVATNAGPRGLAPSPPDRRWLLFSLAPESRAELTRIQREFKRTQSEPNTKGGGSIAVGIAQEGIALRDPVFANTRWESWLQTSQKDGFFELWSGTVAALLRSAEARAPAHAAPERRQ